MSVYPLNKEKSIIWSPLLLVVIYSFLSHLFLVVRYSGRWTDSDSSWMTVFIKAVQDSGTLTPTIVYKNGFGFQLLTASISDVTGLSVQTLQSLYPALGFLLIVMAYVLFQEFLNNRRIAIISIFLLALQPEILISVNRSTHEKFSIYLMLAAFLVILKISSNNLKLKQNIPYLLTFYLFVFALISFNLLFGMIVLASLVGVLIIGAITAQWSLNMGVHRTLTILLIPYVFLITTFYKIYPPAEYSLWISSLLRAQLLGTVTRLPPIQRFLFFSTLVVLIDLFILRHEARKTLDRFIRVIKRHSKEMRYLSIVLVAVIYVLLLINMPRFFWGSNPSSFKYHTWILLTLIDWIIIPLAFVMALHIISNVLNQKKVPTRSLQLINFFLAWTFLLLFSVIMDFAQETGPQSQFIGSNLKLRIFVLWMFLLIPLAGLYIDKIIHVGIKREAKAIFVILIIFFSLASLMKSTNEPLLTDNWIFYTQPEEAGLKWIGRNLRDTNVWGGRSNFRIGFAYVKNSAQALNNVNFGHGSSEYVFLSSIEEAVEEPRYEPPTVEGRSLVYDSGYVKIYKGL